MEMTAPAFRRFTFEATNASGLLRNIAKSIWSKETRPSSLVTAISLAVSPRSTTSLSESVLAPALITGMLAFGSALASTLVSDSAILNFLINRPVDQRNSMSKSIKLLLTALSELSLM